MLSEVEASKMLPSEYFRDAQPCLRQAQGNMPLAGRGDVAFDWGVAYWASRRVVPTIDALERHFPKGPFKTLCSARSTSEVPLYFILMVERCFPE